MGNQALAIAVLALPASLAACNITQLTPTSEVIRTRVAGIKAEPAEIGLGESTTLSALLVHPPGPAPEMGALWFACVEAGDAAGCIGLDFQSFFAGGSGDDDDSTQDPEIPEDFDPRDLQFGVGETFTYTAHGPSIDAAWAALEPADRVEGLTVLVSVNFVERSDEELQDMLLQMGLAMQQGDEGAASALADELAGLMDESINAARRVVVSDPSAGTPEAVACNAQALAANRNPTLDGVLLHLADGGADSGFTLGELTFVDPGSTLVLRPLMSEDSVEDYLYITTDGVTECRREAPWFAWLSNGGDIDHDYTFIADPEDLEEVAGRPKVNRIHTPEDEEFTEPLDLWLVVRDRRGGMDWRQWKLVPEDAR